MRTLRWLAIGLSGWMAAVNAGAQGGIRAAGPEKTVPALMLSDIHFDPFRDPAKVARLAAAETTGWEKILSEPVSAGQAQAFAALQSGCGSKGIDTDEELFAASLKAAKQDGGGPRFIVISGDLLVHGFDCKYLTLQKSGGVTGYAAFAAKTANYVLERVEAAFPGVPVYVALGNNDSGCGDYRINGHDGFLAGTSAAVMAGLRGAGEAERREALTDYKAEGYFAVTLPAPMVKTRLLVFDDKDLSRKYTDCGGRPEPANGAATMKWLKHQLEEATQQGQNVWVLAHIPPGVDVYATLKKGTGCEAAETFLAPSGGESLGRVLAAHADVVRLGVFGHSHMDEMKVLVAEDGKSAVPVKIVASISPVNGNVPSFTVAQIDPATGTMEDYTVFRAANKKGAGAWAQEYSFGATYRQKSFSGSALQQLVEGFHGDAQGANPASQAYEQYFAKGFPFSPLILAWPQYVCGIDHDTEAGYRACACGAK